MDGTNSGCSSSNLIILSPEELAKLGLDLLLPDEKTENSIKVESNTSRSKKQKLITKRKLETAISNPSAKLPIHDSNLDEPKFSKPRRGRPRKSKDDFNTSEISNASQTRDNSPTKKVKGICFKKPAVNMLTSFLSKKPPAELKKSENDSIYLEEEKHIPEKSSKTRLTESKPTLLEKCVSKRTYEGEQVKQIMEDSEKPDGVVKPEAMKTCLKLVHTDEHESVPALEQECFIRQKQSNLCQNIGFNYKGTEFSEKDKSSPNEMSASSTTNIKKDVIVLSNTTVSFTKDELKHSEISNTSQTRDNLPTKKVKGICFKKHAVNMLTSFLSKKPPAELKTEKSENDSIHLKEEKCIPEKREEKCIPEKSKERSSKTCLTESEPTVLEKCMPERTYEGEQVEQIIEDSENPDEVVKPNNAETMKTCLKLVITDEYESIPALEQECFIRQKPKRTEFSEKDKSSPNEMSASSTTDIKKDVIVLSNTTVSLTKDELKHLISPIRIIPMNQTDIINKSSMITNTTDEVSDEKNNITQSDHLEIPEVTLLENNMPKDKQIFLVHNTKIEPQETIFDNTSHDREHVSEEKNSYSLEIKPEKFKAGYSKIVEDIVQIISDPELSGETIHSEKDLPSECKAIKSTLSAAKPDIPSKNHENPIEQISKNSTVYGEISNLNEQDPVSATLSSIKDQNEIIENNIKLNESAENNSSNKNKESSENNSDKNKKLRRSRIVHMPKIIKPSTPKALNINKQTTENQVEIQNVSPLILNETANILPEKTITKNIVEQDVLEVEDKEDIYNASSLKSPLQSITTEKQSPDLSLGEQILDGNSNMSAVETASLNSAETKVPSQDESATFNTSNKSKEIQAELCTDESLKKEKSDTSPMTTINVGYIHDPSDTGSENLVKNGFDGDQHAGTSSSISKLRMQKQNTIISELNSSSTNDKKNNQSENQNKGKNLSTYTVENSKSTPMKKGGRKRKNSDNQSKVETPASCEMELSTSGRKRRNLNDYGIINNIANDNHNENEIVGGNDVESEGPDFTLRKIEVSQNFTSKKRGRPKKNRVELVTDSENDQSNQINKPSKLEKHLEESEFNTNKVIKCNLTIKEEEFKCVGNAKNSNKTQERKGKLKKRPLKFDISGVDDFNENSPKVEPSESDIECRKEISICSNTPTPLKTPGRKRKDDNQLRSETIIQSTIRRRTKQVNYSEEVDTADGDLTTDNGTIQSDSIFELETISSRDDPMLIETGGENDQVSNEKATGGNYDWTAVENQSTRSKSKYTFNGQTSMMMHSIFSAAFKDTPQSNSPEIQKNRRGRPRSNVNSMVLDEEGNVFCVICETKIPQTDWEDHNRFKHYSLAWCEGQDMLAIDDDNYVKKMLRHHPKKKIKLWCYKCDHSSTTVLSYIVHLEECRGILVEGMVVCAICDLKMERDKWIQHKLTHNNLAWRIGDVPMDLNNQNLVVYVLNALYKAKKPLNCEKCGTTKKSVVGYMSHRAQCGVDIEKTQIECEICFKKMLPVSMITHLKGCHGPKEQKSNYFDVVVDAPLKKRRAATNALSMLERINDEGGLPYFLLQMNFKEHSFVIPLLENELKQHHVLSCKYKNCKFQVDNIETLLEHMADCSLKPNEYYTCTKCLSTLSQEEKKGHLKQCLNVTASDDEYTPLDLSDDDEKQLSRKKQKLSKTAMVNGITKEISYRSVPRCIMSCRQKSPTSLLFPKAFKYTSDFCQMHYNQANLLNNLRYTNSDWCLLNEDLMDIYLPKMVKSCRVAWKRVKDEYGILLEEATFKEFEIFEHVQDDYTATIFCGGPISALAWMPTPYQMANCNQILAVATYKDYDEKYSSFTYYNEPSVIQFWNFGMLRNKMKIPEPKLYFCLAVDFGPVWNVEWCPSGCFDEDQAQGFDMQRKGVLAISGSVPSVYIYAIPVLEDEQMELIYKVKPLLKLQLVLGVDMMKRETYPSKMSWSKAQGHKRLAVGYTDGTVGIFNLTTDSHLLKFKDEVGIDVILPYKVIKAHKHCITALTLIHLNGGARWLFTGSFDRYLSVWDLTNDNAYITSSKRVISDGFWLTNWVTYVAASDESGSNSALVHGLVNSHRNYLSEPVPLLKAHSTISSISFSDWLNAFLQSSSEGEICLYLPSQLLYALDNAKHQSLSYYLSTTYLIDTTKSGEERKADYDQKKYLQDHVSKKVGSKKGTIAEVLERSETCNAYEPLMFKEASDRYGILFCDLTRDKVKDFPSVSKRNTDFSYMKQSSPDRYPLQALTKISFNPNCYSSLYFAAGYQAGFVRLNYLKFLENDAQVKI